MWGKIKEKLGLDREDRETAAKIEVARKQEIKEKREAAKAKKIEKAKSESLRNPKDIATSAGEAYVTILSVELDPENPGQGAFNLDFNDFFVAHLIKAGFKGKTDVDIVDNWFTEICRNIVLETYAQEMADPDKRAAESNRKDIGNGRTEIY